MLSNVRTKSEPTALLRDDKLHVTRMRHSYLSLMTCNVPRRLKTKWLGLTGDNNSTRPNQHPAAQAHHLHQQRCRETLELHLRDPWILEHLVDHNRETVGRLAKPQECLTISQKHLAMAQQSEHVMPLPQPELTVAHQYNNNPRLTGLSST